MLHWCVASRAILKHNIKIIRHILITNVSNIFRNFQNSNSPLRKFELDLPISGKRFNIILLLLLLLLSNFINRRNYVIIHQNTHTHKFVFNFYFETSGQRLHNLRLKTEARKPS